MGCLNIMENKDKIKIQNILQSYASLHRFELFVVIFFTSGLCWLISFALYHSGLNVLWIRYAISLLLSYMTLSYLLLIWLHTIASRISKKFSLEEPTKAKSEERGGSGWDISGIEKIFDAEAEGISLFIIVIAILLIVLAIVGILIAPYFLAELFTSEVAIILMFNKYKKLHLNLTYSGIIKYTLLPFLAFCTVVVVLALVTGYQYPHAETFMEVWKEAR